MKKGSELYFVLKMVKENEFMLWPHSHEDARVAPSAHGSGLSCVTKMALHLLRALHRDSLATFTWTSDI